MSRAAGKDPRRPRPPVRFQHEDGGWGWWETDDSHPFMTAYVVAGLVQAQAAGVKVQHDADRQASPGCSRICRAIRNCDPDLRAYIAYSLAVAGSRMRPR